MTVDHNHFYWGHGMSTGSETNGGSAKIRVSDLSLDGPDNDIRIKSNGSRGGLVHDVVYDDDAPVTILVLDELNSRFEDMSFSRQMMMKYRIAKHSPTLLLANQHLARPSEVPQHQEFGVAGCV
jgi:polygalacturonase